MLINILLSYSREKKEEFYRKKGIFVQLYAFSGFDRTLTGNFSFWTCDLCLRIANLIHLHRTFLTYLNILINSFLLVLHMNLSNSFIHINESKTIPPHPKIVACPHHQNRPRIACITAPAQKSSFSEEYCTLVRTSAEKTYAIQNENQKTLSLLPYSKPAGCSNLANPPPHPLCGDTVLAKKNSLHSDRQLGDTKHALADMDGRLCASQVAEQSMQHPAKGRQKARSYIKADLLDCPNRIACLLPYPSCPATTKNRPRPPSASLDGGTTSEISGYRQPNRKNASHMTPPHLSCYLGVRG